MPTLASPRRTSPRWSGGCATSDRPQAVVRLSSSVGYDPALTWATTINATPADALS
jgi:hypothetical protein